MSWLLVDLALVVAALALLGVLALRLWRQVKALSTAVRSASDTLAPATRAMAKAQAARTQRETTSDA